MLISLAYLILRRVLEVAALRFRSNAFKELEMVVLRHELKGSTRLSLESEAAYQAIDPHFHDLRHEGGSRLLEGGWPVHHVQHMLGHASLQQTSTYLNATLRGLHESMRTLEESRNSCKSLASSPTRGHRPTPSKLPPQTGTH